MAKIFLQLDDIEDEGYEPQSLRLVVCNERNVVIGDVFMEVDPDFERGVVITARSFDEDVHYDFAEVIG